MRERFVSIIEKLKNSKLFKDSFWAVFGNGMGNALLLFAGILIARMLGKDLYGEYGVVKTTMFHIAAFSTFGLGYTSTKFIAQYTSENTSHIRSIAKAAMKITIVSSLILCALLVIFADQLALFVKTPQLATSFRFLGFIVICKALSTTASGIVSGFKDFKRQGRNNIISGLLMLCLAPTLTYFWGLRGSLLSLLISQFVLCVLNLVLLKSLTKDYALSEQSFIKPLLVFSIPVAMQEMTYALSHWGGPLLLTRYASIGETGLYSAAGQWNAIIRFIPALLSSVVLSYLSSATNASEHKKLMSRVLSINFVCALIPFLIVFVFSGLIVRMYGQSFDGLQSVLNILIFSTVFSVVARVFQNEFISRGKNWLTFFYRSGKDVVVILSLYLVLRATNGVNGAMNYALLDVVVNIIYTALLAITYIIAKKHF
jgi:O-antigen/teichoic acid export membrane protein